LVEHKLTVGAVNLEVILNNSQELIFCHVDNATCLHSEDQPVLVVYSERHSKHKSILWAKFENFMFSSWHLQ